MQVKAKERASQMIIFKTFSALWQAEHRSESPSVWVNNKLFKLAVFASERVPIFKEWVQKKKKKHKLKTNHFIAVCPLLQSMGGGVREIALNGM